MEEARAYKISYDEDCSEIETLFMKDLGNDLYILEMAPLFFEGVGFGDVIKAHKGVNDILIFDRVVKKAERIRYDWVLPKEVVDSRFFRELINEIKEVGGHCELAFGGVFIVHLNKDCDFDISTELQKVIDICKEQQML